MTNVAVKRTGEESRFAAKINGKVARDHLDEPLRTTAEDTLNNLPDSEVNQLCAAIHYDELANRVDIRSVSYNLHLKTTASKFSW